MKPDDIHQPSAPPVGPVADPGAADHAGEASEQKLATLGAMATGIAHACNNLLTGILGNAELSLMDLPPGTSVAPYLNSIIESAEKAGALCRQVLAHAEPDRPYRESFDLNTLLESMDDLIRALTKQVRFHLAPAPEPCILKANPGRIRMLILSLLRPATEHADMEEVRLSTRRTSAPSDDGAPQANDVVLTFTYVSRGAPWTSPIAGLADTVADLGGTCTQTGGSHGSTITLRLPLEAAAGTVPAPRERGFTSARVLLVDDEAHVLTVARALLEREGFEVTCACSGAEALALLAEGDDPALVFLDLTMPHMNGPAAFEGMRALRPNLRVVLCSGYHEDELRSRYGEAGFAGFLQKPFRLKSLRAALDAVLG